MSAYVLLNLLNELRKSDKMRGLPGILLLFRKEFDKFNNTRILFIHDIKITLKSHFWRKTSMGWCGRHFITLPKSVNH